jgi:NADP-dependent 3-hydroxy acid dehydrogenase YdfG
VRNEAEVQRTLTSLPPDWQHIDVLVNNAGLAAGKEKIFEAVLSDWEQMIDTNVKGLLYMSRLISQQMIKQGSGHIVNISSIAGKETYIGGSVYCGSKHAVDAITITMRKELIDKGIKVSMVSPGLVNTEFSKVRFKGDMKAADDTYKGILPLLGEDVASAIRYIIDAPAHVNIADILILPSAQASSTIVHRN